MIFGCDGVFHWQSKDQVGKNKILHRAGPSTTLTSTPAGRLNVFTERIISDVRFLLYNLAFPPVPSNTHLRRSNQIRNGMNPPKVMTFRLNLTFDSHPLLPTMEWTWLPGCNSGVKAATHSSMSSSRGWWEFCSTSANIGINEPNLTMLVSAKPFRCSEDKSKRAVSARTHTHTNTL